MIDEGGGDDVGPLGVGEVGGSGNDEEALSPARWRAISSSVAGGVAGSSAPAIARVGALMTGRSWRRSRAAIASQQRGVALGGGGRDHRLVGRPDVGMGREELGSEPAFDDGLGDGVAAAGPHGRGALGPG